jgi:2-dehydro-3-deoxygalactonokinase
MPEASFVAGDWGTSHLRLYLCDEDGAIVGTATGPGIAAARGDAAGAFARAVASWDRAYGKLPAILCGMVGSTIGWREVPYLPCPLYPPAIGDGALRWQSDGRRIVLAPGISCRNPLQAPDVMRGEETQILGALQILPELGGGRRLLCMPGTHTKWVAMNDGVVENFLTALSGELFDVLRRHSVLLNTDNAAEDGDAFTQALARSLQYPDADLLHLLFEVRARQLKGEIERDDAPSYLSGLIIGRDVSCARRLFSWDRTIEVVIVGTPELGRLYGKALGATGISTRAVESQMASVAGLKALRHAMLAEAAHDG